MAIGIGKEHTIFVCRLRPPAANLMHDPESRRPLHAHLLFLSSEGMAIGKASQSSVQTPGGRLGGPCRRLWV